jgi:hypothetical protein
MAWTGIRIASAFNDVCESGFAIRIQNPIIKKIIKTKSSFLVPVL